MQARFYQRTSSASASWVDSEPMLVDTPSTSQDHATELPATFQSALHTPGFAPHPNGNAAEDMPDQDACNPQQATVEDVPDEDIDARFHQPFPTTKRAGTWKHLAPTSFEKLKIADEEIVGQGEVWGPFESEDDWEMAKWLVKNVGHNQAEDFLKLNMVRSMKTAPLADH